MSSIVVGTCCYCGHQVREHQQVACPLCNGVVTFDVVGATCADCGSEWDHAGDGAPCPECGALKGIQFEEDV